MGEEKTDKISRSDLYREAWEMSLVKVAVKYDVPYSRLYKLCKDNNIPIPPKGYWTKLEFGKPVEKIPLPDSETKVIDLWPAKEAKNSKTDGKSTEERKLQNHVKEATQNKQSKNVYEHTFVAESPVETYTMYGKTYNKYERETLYREVWEKPVTEVAKRYGVSDVAIHKICKALNVPVPPRGYWAKVKANKPVKKIPLPEGKGRIKVLGVRTDTELTPKIEKEALAFLTEEERNMIFEISRQIQLPGEQEIMPHEITAYKKRVNEWNKSDRRDPYSQRSPKNYEYCGREDKRPFLAGVISREALPRAYRILGALYHVITPLGCSVTDDLEFVMRDETVELEIYERQSKENHKLTIQEERELRKYEQESKIHSYAYKPTIRKYDYVFNGNLTLNVSGGKSFKDTATQKLEDRLGEIMIDMYEASEVKRIQREEREEAARKAEEERRLKEERQELYNAEIDKTLALVNCANDFDIACKIRAYVAAVQNRKNLSEEEIAWIEWAKKKADWFDPVIARYDNALGKRNHEKNSDSKELKHSYGYWRW